MSSPQEFLIDDGNNFCFLINKMDFIHMVVSIVLHCFGDNYFIITKVSMDWVVLTGFLEQEFGEGNPG